MKRNHHVTTAVHTGTPRRVGVGIPLLLAGCATTAGGQGNDGALPPISPNRPTFSDGTSLVPVGHVQMETGWTFARRTQAGTGTERHSVPEVVGRFRASESLEVRLLWGGYAWSESDDGGVTARDDGATDPAVAIVVPIAAQEGWRPAFAIEVGTTLGVGDSDIGSGHADPVAKVLWSYGGGELPEWLGVGGNLVAAYPTEAGDRFTQTAASVYATFAVPGPDTSWFVEWFLVARPANNVASTQSVDVGVVQRLSPTIAVDARIGCGLDDRADDVFGGVGISFLF